MVVLYVPLFSGLFCYTNSVCVIDDKYSKHFVQLKILNVYRLVVDRTV